MGHPDGHLSGVASRQKHYRTRTGARQKLLDELIQMMIGMTDDQLRKIKNFILMKLSIKAPTDTKENSVTSCPICKSNHIVKNGKRNGKQQFLCKGCKHSFNTDFEFCTIPTVGSVFFLHKKMHLKGCVQLLGCTSCSVCSLIF